MVAKNNEGAPLGVMSLEAVFSSLLKEAPSAAIRVVTQVLEANEAKRETLGDPEEFALWFRAVIGFNDFESFAVIFVDRGRHVVGREVFPRGSTTKTVLFPRMLFSAALACGATGMILAHNHPSGMLRPSDEDRGLTRTITQLGASLEVELIDHLIVTGIGHWSFRANGYLC